jgi:hypothetical protein
VQTSPGEVRWCLRCFEPVRELTPRGPVWAPGEFVDTPIVTKGPVPHWSRWEKSATTFGPTGRIAITVVALVWLVTAVTQSPITIIFVLPLVTLLLRDVWRRGWVIPPDQTATAAPAPSPQPMQSWLWDGSDAAGTLVAAAISFVGVAIMLYVANPIARFIVIVTAMVACIAWLVLKVGGAR